jgi:hypothetical protein
LFLAIDRLPSCDRMAVKARHNNGEDDYWSLMASDHFGLLHVCAKRVLFTVVCSHIIPPDGVKCAQSSKRDRKGTLRAESVVHVARIRGLRSAAGTVRG